MRQCYGTNQVNREVTVVCRDSSKCQVERLFGEGCEHNQRFEEVSDASSQGTVMRDVSAYYNAWLDEDRSTLKPEG